MTAHHLVRLYYLATPLFFLVDVIGHAPLRVAFLADARMRFGYYALCLGIGLLMRVRPQTTPLLGTLETSVNFTLVLLSILWPVYSAVGVVETGTLPPLLTMPQLMNAALSGAMLAVTFHTQQLTLARLLGLRRRLP
jgi:hypothetical protein